MRFLKRPIVRRRQRGLAAVELSIILPILILLLTVPIFFARVFWYYSVAQKAAHDAARFLSTATQAEMRTTGFGGSEAQAAAVARWIAASEAEELQPVLDALIIDVQCGIPNGTNVIAYGTCGLGVPQMVRIWVRMRVTDTVFPESTYEHFGPDGLLLSADVTMRYVGN